MPNTLPSGLVWVSSTSDDRAGGSRDQHGQPPLRGAPLSTPREPPTEGGALEDNVEGPAISTGNTETGS